ncbi:MAG: Uma2 family endonuclease [Bacteroidetes bacterium SW_9_63_38]|nr:MAG: Uma2 family endonuclease [Bacteroidetes bacterium SW_9_63_38]
MATTTAPSPSFPSLPSNDQVHRRERRLSVDDYLAMGRAGILDEDDRVELLNGRLINMTPIGPPHSHSVNALERLLARRLYDKDPAPAHISVQNPIQLSEHSAPEPDLVLYDPEMPRDRHPHPEDIFLVVEVAESSIDYDRTVKAAHYAAAGLPECWLVDLSHERVDVFRQPEDDGYAERHRHRAGDELPISMLPDIKALPVDEIVEG